MSRGNVGARGTVRQQNRLVTAFERATVCLALGLGGCAHGASKTTATAGDPNNTLSGELSALRAQLHERDQLVTQLESRLSLLEAEQRQLRYAVAEREVAPVGLRETVRIGERAQDEEHVREPKREARPMLRLYEDKRPSIGDQELQSVPVVSERLPVAPLPSGLGMARPASDGGDAYLSAIDLLRRRDFAAALAALDSFLASTPADERAGRALFWRGEALFAQKRYDQALSSFESSLSREPRGEKAADALLKIGLCHKRLGAPDRARDAMNQLKAQFPQSHAARLAQAEEA